MDILGTYDVIVVGAGHAGIEAAHAAAVLGAKISVVDIDINTQNILPEAAENCSITERRAEEAERDVDDIKKAEYMKQFIGERFEGYISGVTGFGIFVELDNTVEGLVHISRLDVKRTEKVEDVVNVGDSIIVKCIEIDDQGRINLSRRDALIELEGMTPENDIEEAPRKPRRDNRRGDRR